MDEFEGCALDRLPLAMAVEPLRHVAVEILLPVVAVLKTLGSETVAYETLGLMTVVLEKLGPALDVTKSYRFQSVMEAFEAPGPPVVVFETVGLESPGLVAKEIEILGFVTVALKVRGIMMTESQVLGAVAMKVYTLQTVTVGFESLVPVAVR